MCYSAPGDTQKHGRSETDLANTVVAEEAKEGGRHWEENGENRKKRKNRILLNN